jgi:hypothetical protein
MAAPARLVERIILGNHPGNSCRPCQATVEEIGVARLALVEAASGVLDIHRRVLAAVDQFYMESGVAIRSARSTVVYRWFG